MKNKLSDKITVTIYHHPDASAAKRNADFTENAHATEFKNKLNNLMLELQQQNTYIPGASF